MYTREDALSTGPVRAPRGSQSVGGLGQATLTALTALGGCAVLIGLGAAMSMCWAVHPLLMVLAAIAVAWLGSRLAGLAFRSGGRSS